jgi:hypothetical protein
MHRKNIMSNYTLKQYPVIFLSMNLCLMYFNPPWYQRAFHKSCSMAQNWVLTAVLRICLLWCYAMCNYQLPKVSNEHSAFILSHPLHLDSFTTEMDAFCSLKALVLIYPSSWCNIPEHLILGTVWIIIYNTTSRIFHSHIVCCPEWHMQLDSFSVSGPS